MRKQAAINILLIIGFAVGPMKPPRTTSAQNPPPQHASRQAGLPVDINHASLEKLLKVPGMTRTWAGRIVRFRPYRSKQDLLDRGIVSGEVYSRIKDYIIAHREKQ